LRSCRRFRHGRHIVPFVVRRNRPVRTLRTGQFEPSASVGEPWPVVDFPVPADPNRTEDHRDLDLDSRRFRCEGSHRNHNRFRKCFNHCLSSSVRRPSGIRSHVNRVACSIVSAVPIVNSIRQRFFGIVEIVSFAPPAGTTERESSSSRPTAALRSFRATRPAPPSAGRSIHALSRTAFRNLRTVS